MYDAIIVGGGHNGLVAGFYLSRAGLRTLVLERRSVRRRRLQHRGVRARVPCLDRRLRALDAARVDLAGHAPRAARHRRRPGRSDPEPLSRRRPLLPRRRHGRERRGDAAVLDGRRARAPAVRGRSRRARAGGASLVQLDGARPARAIAAAISATSRSGAASGCEQRKRLADLAYLFSTSANQFLSERFESEHVKAALGWHAINDSVAGPVDPGHRVRAAARPRERGGRTAASGSGGSCAAAWACSRRRWPTPRARPGARSDATPRSSGCSRGAAAPSGVRLAGGEEMRAPRVLSNADPKRTFLSLCDRRRPSRRVRRADRGVPVHGHEHQDQPGGERAAVRAGPARGRRAAVPHRASWS